MSTLSKDVLLFGHTRLLRGRFSVRPPAVTESKNRRWCCQAEYLRREKVLCCGRIISATALVVVPPLDRPCMACRSFHRRPCSNEKLTRAYRAHRFPLTTRLAAPVMCLGGGPTWAGSSRSRSRTTPGVAQSRCASPSSASSPHNPDGRTVGERRCRRKQHTRQCYDYRPSESFGANTFFTIVPLMCSADV